MYYWILAITILLFVGSLSVTNAIAKKGVKREYQEYNESLFKQAQAEMERSIQELIQIAYNIMSDREVNAYLNTKSLSERSRLLEEVILSGVQQHSRRLKAALRLFLCMMEMES